MNEMERTTILLTGAGAPVMPGILRCLKAANDKRLLLVGVDMNPFAACRAEFEAFYTVPAASQESFVEQLLDICEKESVALIIPCVTRELKKLAQCKLQFEQKGIKIAVMERERLDIVNDKGKLLTWMKENGLPVPDFYLVENWEQMERAAYAVGWPEKAFCAKAVQGNGSRAIRVIETAEALAKDFFERKPDGMVISYEDLKTILLARQPWPYTMMAMEFLPGTEYAVDILADRGEILASVCRKASLVVSSNQMQCIVEDHEQVQSLCAQVVKKLELSGNIGFDLKEDALGSPQVMEINPRFTGGIVACCAAGVNLPYLGIQYWLGEKVSCQLPQQRVRMIRRLEEIFLDENDKRIYI